MSDQAENVVRADAVEAKRFDLIDGDGETRMTLGTTPEGNAVAANFIDARGNGRIILAIQEDGNATISLLDQEQQERVRITSGVMGNAIVMYDREQNTRLLLQVDQETDGAEIHMVDAAGRPQIIISQVGRDKDDPAPDIFVRED